MKPVTLITESPRCRLEFVTQRITPQVKMKWIWRANIDWGVAD